MKDLVEKLDSQDRFPAEVERVLHIAGWHPGREVELEELAKWVLIECPVGKGSLQLRMFSSAFHVLREFGGLRVKQPPVPGIDIHRQSFVIDPIKVAEETIWPFNWFNAEWIARGALFPLGTCQNGEWAFAITGDGRIISDNYGLVGKNIEDALATLILGIKPQPLEMTKEMEELHGDANYLFATAVERLYHGGDCLNRANSTE